MARYFIVIGWALLIGSAGGGCNRTESTLPQCETAAPSPIPLPKATIPSKNESNSSIVEASEPMIHVAFSAPEGAQVSLDAIRIGPHVTPSESSTPTMIVMPVNRYAENSGIYRLKVVRHPRNSRGDVHPSLEIRQRSFPNANDLPEQVVSMKFTEEDYERVFAGEFVTNVVYLTDPDFRKPPIERVAKIVTIASTALAAGIDPIIEADRNGTILAIIQMGPNCIWTNPDSSIMPVEKVRNSDDGGPSKSESPKTSHPARSAGR